MIYFLLKKKVYDLFSYLINCFQVWLCLNSVIVWWFFATKFCRGYLISVMSSTTADLTHQKEPSFFYLKVLPRYRFISLCSIAIYICFLLPWAVTNPQLRICWALMWESTILLVMQCPCYPLLIGLPKFSYVSWFSCLIRCILLNVFGTLSLLQAPLG